MTREEAIQVLNMVEAHGLADEAKRMAIEALHREEAEEKGYCHRIRPRNVEVVVRCKDCRHRVHDEERGLYYCEMYYGQGDVSDENFCQWGERREP